MWVFVLVTLCDESGASIPVHKYSTRVVKTKYGALRGVIVHSHPPVEAFLGVPYATPPVGSLRIEVDWMLWSLGAKQKSAKLFLAISKYLNGPYRRLLLVALVRLLSDNYYGTVITLIVLVGDCWDNDSQYDERPTVVVIVALVTGTYYSGYYIVTIATAILVTTIM
ncbi:hypothetical protein ILUMI_13271, partial [Ignelater luminosus]